MHKLTSKIQCIGIKRIYRHRRIPIVSQMQTLRMLRLDKCIAMLVQIVMIHIAPLVHRIALTRFPRNRSHIKTIAKQNLLPLAILDATIYPMIRRTYPTAVVLQTPVNVVRLLIVHVHVIKLSYRNVLRITPRFATIVRDV